VENIPGQAEQHSGVGQKVFGFSPESCSASPRNAVRLAPEYAGLLLAGIEGDPNVRLESFIVSNTPSHTMRMLWGMNKPEMAARHIMFQEEDQDIYVKTMLESVAAG
jgi:hypothetical protein